MNLSVVVPAYNSERTLRPCLEALRAADSGIEIVVVDDASTDASADVAKAFASRVIRQERNEGPAAARLRGAREAGGDLIVFVDADVVVRSDIFSRLRSFFGANADTAAVTGLLSTEHPNPDFWSQYKNLYMNHVFHRASEHASFLYGSVFAVRRPYIELMPVGARVGEDTAFGQTLRERGADVRLLKDLEVVHLKRYGALSLFRNDFRIPFHWGRLFVAGGWRQLGRSSGGFSHASRAQLASLALSWAVMAALAFRFPEVAAGAALLWLALNAGFLFFLGRRRGLFFALASVPVTFIDHLVMALGAAGGIVTALAKRATWRERVAS